MKRTIRVASLLVAVGLTDWVFVRSESEPSHEQSCAYYGESCVPAAIFPRAYFHLFP
jgi:hypothetical protein